MQQIGSNIFRSTRNRSAAENRPPLGWMADSEPVSCGTLCQIDFFCPFDGASTLSVKQFLNCISSPSGRVHHMEQGRSYPLHPHLLLSLLHGRSVLARRCDRSSLHVWCHKAVTMLHLLHLWIEDGWLQCFSIDISCYPFPTI